MAEGQGEVEGRQSQGSRIGKGDGGPSAAIEPYRKSDESMHPTLTISGCEGGRTGGGGEGEGELLTFISPH